jgi:hypothetical protein
MKEEKWELDEIREWESFAFRPLHDVRYFQDTLQLSALMGNCEVLIDY